MAYSNVERRQRFSAVLISKSLRPKVLNRQAREMAIGHQESSRKGM